MCVCSFEREGGCLSNMVQPSDFVRYGIVGVGMMGMEHLYNILCLDKAVVTCIADEHPLSRHLCLQFFRSKYPHLVGSVRVFENSVRLFKANVCDVCVIATPNHTHRDVLLSAFKYGDPFMHILVEKPMCTTIDDCREVINAAQGRPGLLYVGLEYRYMPPVCRIIKDAHAGVIGPPLMVSIREHRFPFLVKVGNWNRFSCNTGGTFVEKCCHFFDLFNRILRPHTPQTVYASGSQQVNHLDENYDGRTPDILDNGYVVVNYSSGRRACLDLCMFAEASHAQEEVCIVGGKGKLEAFLPQLEVRTGIRNHHTCANVQVELVDDHRIKYRGHHYGSSYLEHLDIMKHVFAFRDCVDKSNTSSVAGLYEGLVSVAMGVAAHISIQQKRVVNMAEILTSEELKSCSKSV